MIINGLSNATTSAQALGNLILVSPQKNLGYQPQTLPSWDKNAQVGESFLFHYEGEQEVNLQADITDHFVENNTVVQDQVAIRPIIVKTHGYIGELNNVPPKELELVKVIADKLVAVSAYAPQLSPTALIAYNNALQIYQVAQNVKNAAVGTWSTINSTGGQTIINGSTVKTKENQTKQQVAFLKLYGYFMARTLFTVQTPWAIFQDMAIQSLRAVQEESTRVISDFEITFKMMRFASTETVGSQSFNRSAMQGRASNQASPEVDLGPQTLNPSTNSFSSVLSGVA